MVLCPTVIARMAIYSLLYSHVHSKYDFLHDFAGNGVLNVLRGLRFRAMTRLLLHLLVYWPVFTIYICCFITKIQFQMSVQNILKF